MEDRAERPVSRKLNTHRDTGLELIASEPVARLATTRPSGKPHLVPITFVVDGERIITMVDHKPKTTTHLIRLANIEVNPGVSVLVDHYEERWSELWWVRVDGVGTIHTGGETWARARSLLAAKYHQYSDQPPTGPAIVIDVESVSSWHW